MAGLRSHGERAPREYRTDARACGVVQRLIGALRSAPSSQPRLASCCRDVAVGDRPVKPWVSLRPVQKKARNEETTRAVGDPPHTCVLW
jgi:hypothetical protein